MPKIQKKLNAKMKSVDKFSKFIADPSNFLLLDVRKKDNYRKKMFDRLNSVFFPAPNYNTWKTRYLYPESKIPKTNRRKIVLAMQEHLALTLQEMLADMTDEKTEIDTIINELNESINRYKDEAI